MPERKRLVDPMTLVLGAIQHDIVDRVADSVGPLLGPQTRAAVVEINNRVDGQSYTAWSLIYGQIISPIS